MAEKTTNHRTIDNMNELVSEDVHGKEDSSIKSSEGESTTMMSLKDAEVLSTPSSESNPSSIQHLEGGSWKPVEYETGIGPSKSDDPETIVREQVIPMLKFSKKISILLLLGTELQQQYNPFSFGLVIFNIMLLSLIYVSYS